MNALFWQELVLIIFAVVIGMPIGCFLRRYFSAKASVPSGRAMHTASTKSTSIPAVEASTPAAVGASAEVTKEADVEDKQIAAQALAEQTNRKMAEQQAELDAPESKAVASEDSAKTSAPSAVKPASDAVEEQAALVSTAGVGGPVANEVGIGAELETEEARIAAALASLPKDASIEQKADAAGVKPALLVAPRNGKADDLKRIKGVGKVIESKLNDLGVHHFDQVANWSRDEVNWVTTFLSFKGRIDREEWIPQARGLMQAEGTDASGLTPAVETAPVPAPQETPETEIPTKTKAKPKTKPKAAPKAKTSETKAPQTKAEAVVEDAVEPKADAVSDADLNADGGIDDEEARIAAAIAALPKDASIEEKANVAGKKPRLLKAPRKAGADDLKRIKGVGKVIEGKLNDLGIYHFDQIAKWNRKEINWVTTFLSFKGRVDRENWIEQAKLLASGEETEFSKRVDKGQVGSSKG
ncbi:hypothetical protein [Cohaesibacter celericrescens]|uniref:hypothetical protein n=1 Tax=Cohaesibacter celericrescens TaxID=2067669 RepID=UPI003568AE7B